MAAFLRLRWILPFVALALPSFIACSGKEPAPVGVAGSGGAPPGSGGSPAAGGTATPSCVNYDAGFRPQVYVPVCSNCHGVLDDLPDFGTAAAAQAACGSVGDLVRRGIMPPDGSGYALTSEQRALVADWTALGCPPTEADIAGDCSEAPGPGPGAGGTPSSGGTTGMIGAILIDRAEWDPDEQELRVEGTVDDAQSTLIAEFTGRTEPMDNDRGSFRGEFVDVPVKPPSVKVTASSGASATAAVVVE